MYAISDSGYRGVGPDDALLQGETRMGQVPAPLLQKIRTAEARLNRDQSLRDSDWTQMADAPLSVAAKLLWATYRQALRDLPALAGFPDVAWPTPPTLDGAAGGVGTVLIP